MLDINKRVIGKFQLEDYQADAISQLYNVIYKIMDKQLDTSEVLLHAPVGSGKTVMGSFLVNFMKDQLKELGYNKDFSYFWISPDTGGINQQSKQTFDEIIKNVEPIDIQEAKTQRSVKENQILFINWERIGKKDSKLLEKSEQINFYDITSNINNYKILIIDEAHKNWQKGGAEAIGLINPDITIHLTATPDKRLQSLPDENKVFVDYKSAQDAGVIKKTIKYNDGITDGVDFEEDKKRNTNNLIDLLDIEQQLILEAINKREYLEKLIEKENEKKLTPLVIIQIPNVSNNNVEKVTTDYVLSFLRKQGVKDNDIAIWLANIKENIDNLNTSSVKYIITKQAITTGWDCPRAHILVKLRQTKSESFDLQTLGRIMRIPRGYNFSHPELSTAYVYSPHEEYKYHNNNEKSYIDDLMYDKKEESYLKDDFKDNIGVLGIPMYKSKKIKDLYVNSSILFDYLKNEFDNINLSNINQEKAFTNIKSEESITIDEKLEGEILLEDGITKLLLSFNDLHRNFLLKTNQFSKVISIQDFIFYILMDKLNLMNIKPYKKAYQILYTVFYNAEDQIINTIEEALKKYRKDDDIIREITSTYEVVEKVYLGETKESTSKVYSYDKEPSKNDYDSKIESKFSNFLNNNDKYIKYWFKNQVGRNHFSITYEEDYLIKEYYPDFIIFDKNNNIYILDSKSNFKDKDYPDTKLKFDSGIKYKNMKLVKDKIKKLGFNKLIFSIVKYVDDESKKPYILLKEEWSDNIEDWTSFEDFLNNNTR